MNLNVIYMQLPGVGSDQRAVSHVVGVVLMVAITVILMSTIGAFAFSLDNDSGDQVPQLEIDCDTDANVVTHAGGDSVDGGNLMLQLPDATPPDDYDIPAGTYTAGDVLVSSPPSVDVTLETRLAWTSPSGGSSILAECGS